ncbi:hypothetical protein [Calothrix sp. NIES-2100]|uniref:hypothetical protein n=1 Tax=Calothrix sp. NIES-2100 TaxID=1954172 RepID=UPI000BBC1B1C
MLRFIRFFGNFISKYAIAISTTYQWYTVDMIYLGIVEGINMTRPIDSAGRNDRGQFIEEPGSLADSPICTKFSKEVDALLRSLPNRSEYVRDAVIAKLKQDGLL